MTTTRPVAAVADRVLLLAAPDLAGLLAALDGVDPDSPPERPAYRGRGPRLGVVDPTPKRLDAARRLVLKGNPVRKRGDLWFSPRPLLAGDAGVVFIFPGLEACFEPRVDDVAEHFGLPVPEISTTTVGRHGAAVMAVGRLLDAAVRRVGIRPAAVVGHSVGEWAAMISGGIVSGAAFDAMVAHADLDALRVPGVEFAVLGCSPERARPVLAGRPEVVISHENSANQTVICGPESAVADVVAQLRACGVICEPLPFRSGFHTPMLEPYLGYFRDGMPSLPMRPAVTPVWSATTAAPFPDEQTAAQALCLRHLVEPVRFRQVIGGLYATGVRVFVQLGPGQLGSLVEDTLRHDVPDADFLVVPANSAQRTGLDQLRRCAVALWVEGAEPDFSALEPPAPETVPEPGNPRGHAGLVSLGVSVPLAAEMAGFLDDMAEAVAQVLRAAGSGEQRETLEVSLRAMPYLRDHSLMRQRAGWPQDEDLRAVMPATTMVAHMIAAAERACPSRVVVALEDVRFHRWLTASPPQQVTLAVEHAGADRARVRLGDHAESTALFGTRYPPPPAPWRAGEERRPALTAAEIYRQGWMFHGPAWRGMTRTVGVSNRTITGVITTPDVPGGLLDNLGQFLGQWLVENESGRWIALPTRIARIDLYGPEPPAGAEVDCLIRVTDIDEDAVTVEGQLCRYGVPIMLVHGWVDRRFDSDERGGAVHRAPAFATLSEHHPGGWWWVAERWRTLASREFYLHRYAGLAECEEYDRLPPAKRRAWLLELIAAKDAVRGWLWDNGAGPIYPAELRVRRHIPGQVLVMGEHGLDLPDLEVAVAHHAEVGVAVVRPAGPGPRPAVEVSEPDGGVDPSGNSISNPGGLPPRSYRVRCT
ncbi:acyltransferase domain-containing protein [Lentzea sp. JNUCC 0626]|uniref:acyltransferase domain-containing protein n=1 Tax=Lentzea sp. JNUCC 0626 TaxID=3367513 RepID=UPI0037488D43